MSQVYDTRAILRTWDHNIGIYIYVVYVYIYTYIYISVCTSVFVFIYQRYMILWPFWEFGTITSVFVERPVHFAAPGLRRKGGWPCFAAAAVSDRRNAQDPREPKIAG